MKTLKEWHESQLDLLDYLGTTPCEIDEDIYYDQLGVVPPAYSKNGLFQVGEAYTHDDNDIPYYFTFKRVELPKTKNSWRRYSYYFIGILPEFNS